MSDEDTLRYLNWETMDDEEVQHWLEKDVRVQKLEAGRHFYFGAELLANGKLIGVVAFLYRGVESRDAAFDVLVNPGFRRQGYGAEMVRGILQFGFGELNLERISSSCDSRNQPAIKMLHNAGMRGEGEWLEAEKIKNDWVNVVWFAKLRREYAQSK